MSDAIMLDLARLAGQVQANLTVIQSGLEKRRRSLAENARKYMRDDDRFHADPLFLLCCLSLVLSKLVDHWAIGASFRIRRAAGVIAEIEFGELPKHKLSLSPNLDERIARLHQAPLEDLVDMIKADRLSRPGELERIGRRLKATTAALKISDLRRSHELLKVPLFPLSTKRRKEEDLAVFAGETARLIGKNLDLTSVVVFEVIRSVQTLADRIGDNCFSSAASRLGKRILAERTDYSAAIAKFWLDNWLLNPPLESALDRLAADGLEADPAAEESLDDLMLLQIMPLLQAVYADHFPYYRTAQEFDEIGHRDPADRNYLSPPRTDEQADA